MAAILSEEHDVRLLTEAVTFARPALVEYGPREDIPRRLNEAVITTAGCALAMGGIFLLLR